MKHSKGVQLGGPLPRKEVEHLKVAREVPQVFPGLSQIPPHLRQVTGYKVPESWWGVHPTPTLTPYAQMPTSPHSHCICIHTLPLHLCPPPAKKKKKKKTRSMWVLGTVRPLPQNPPVSLKGVDYHPHFTDEDTKAGFAPSSKALSPLSRSRETSTTQTKVWRP